MVTIPEKVKALFKQGKAKKSLTVSFPNGEHTALTNEDIISESMTLDESLCSKTEIKFGLSENSGISFQCIGVGNIEGYTIKVSLSIDCSSIGIDDYSIDLGTYIVDSCELTDTDLDEWKVQAYSSSYTDFEGLLTEARREFYWLFQSYSSESITLNLWTLFYTIVNDGISGSAMEGSESSYSIYNQSYGDSTLQVSIIRKGFDSTTYPHGMVRIDADIVFPSSTLDGVYGTINSAIRTATKGVTRDEDAITKATSMAYRFFVQEWQGYANKYHYSYPDSACYLGCPVAVAVTFDGTTTRTELATCSAVGHVIVENSGSATWYVETLEGSGFMQSYVDAYAEVLGSFLKKDRSSDLYIFKALGVEEGLTPSETLTPSNSIVPKSGSVSEVITRGMERDISCAKKLTTKYGMVRCAIGDSLDYYTIDESISYGITDYLIYDISDNYILNNVISAVGLEIDTILARLGKILASVQYMPVDVELVGLPYLETGDMVEVAVGDKRFKTYILSRTIKGIQDLTDNIESKG